MAWWMTVVSNIQGTYLEDFVEGFAEVYIYIALVSVLMALHIMPFNPIALRKAKIVCNFGLSECNRVTQQ